MLLFSGIACAVLIFALFGINALPGITVFTILSGFFTGWCKLAPDTPQTAS